jgi:uncharacterized protein YecE (DUF72 family)
MEEGEQLSISVQAKNIHIGVAGWSIPSAQAHLAPAEGTHLQRYARTLNAVELNRTFYALPRVATVRKWVECVPENFRFSLKLSKTITHELKFQKAIPALKEFIDLAQEFGEKLGPILVQTPPSLEAEDHVLDFLEQFRELFDGSIVMEPRHSTWTDARVDLRLKELRIARVAADPAKVPALATPGGDRSITYFRLHGSPRIYWSEYTEEMLKEWVRQIREAMRSSRKVWVIFDNTARDAAFPNAMRMRKLLSDEVP